MYGHASAEEDNGSSGVEVFELDRARGAADIRPGRLRAKLVRSLEAYLARTAADLDERGEALISQRTMLEQHREQLAAVEAMLAESRRRTGADRLDGKIELELDVLVGLLADRHAVPAEPDNGRAERSLALAVAEFSNLEQRLVELLERLDTAAGFQPDELETLHAELDAHATRVAQLEREREQSSSLLDELQAMLRARDHEVAQLKAVVEAREGELAQTAATLANLQSNLQELFRLRAARLATGEQPEAR